MKRGIIAIIIITSVIAISQLKARDERERESESRLRET